MIGVRHILHVLTYVSWVLGTKATAMELLCLYNTCSQISTAF